MGMHRRLFDGLAAGHRAGIHFAKVMPIVIAIHRRGFGSFCVILTTGMMTTMNGAAVSSAARAGDGHQRSAQDRSVEEQQSQKARDRLELPEW